MDKRFWITLATFVVAVLTLLITAGLYVRKHGCPLFGRREYDDEFDFDFDDYDCDDCGGYCGECAVQADDEQDYTTQEPVVIEESEEDDSAQA